MRSMKSKQLSKTTIVFIMQNILITFLAVQPAVRWTALILWVEGEEEGEGMEEEEVILAFWAIECYAIVVRAFLENYWALLSIYQNAKMLAC